MARLAKSLEFAYLSRCRGNGRKSRFGAAAVGPGASAPRPRLFAAETAVGLCAQAAPHDVVAGVGAMLVALPAPDPILLANDV